MPMQRLHLNRLLPVLCAALLWACKPSAEEPPVAGTGTRAVREQLSCPGTVSQVTYQEYSGPLPDRYTERYIITLDGIQFERTGEEGGPVNRGAWDIVAPAGSVEALFETLGAVECEGIEEIAPQVPEIGGGETLFRIEYEGGGSFGLWYRQGYRYTNAESITAPILEFVHTLRLPDKARNLLFLP